jgi:hypothetical protein
MERNWTYRDEVGSEYGPYSREELERYAGEGRVSAGGSIKGPEGDWTTVEQAGLVIPKIDPDHPTTDQAAAMHQVRAEASIDQSPHQRMMYILLGILLPFFGGIAGVNNLVVGRTSTGVIQLVLGLCALFALLIGSFVIFPLCIGIPMWLGVLTWSIIEASTNTLDGEGRTMS